MCVYADTAEREKDLSKHKTHSRLRGEKHTAFKLISNFLFLSSFFFGSSLSISHFCPLKTGKGVGFKFYAFNFL